MRPDTLHYLRCVLRRLETLKDALPDEMGLSLGNIALADEIDWLDCYIDSLERAGQPPSPEAVGDKSRDDKTPNKSGSPLVRGGE